jgi:hypothetical protein
MENVLKMRFWWVIFKSYRTRLVRVGYDLNLTRGCHRFYYLAPFTVFYSFNDFITHGFRVSVASDVQKGG